MCLDILFYVHPRQKSLVVSVMWKVNNLLVSLVTPAH